MQLSSRQTFSADPLRVHAALTDEAFLAHAAQAMGALRHEVSATGQVTLLRALVEAPAEIRPFVGPTFTLTQESTWGPPAADGARDGTVRVTVDGAPVELVGTTRLAPTASGSTLDYAGDLTVRIPLLGGKLEKAVAPAVLEALGAQERVARDWLTA